MHCCDGYGNMIWDLSSETAHSYFKSWNKQVRLSWNVDRTTHTNLVEDLLSGDLPCLRIQTFSKYPEFVRKLIDAPSQEIRFMINLVKSDARSQTCKNLRYLSNLIDDNCLKISSWSLKDLFPRNVIPQNESYKKSLLTFLLEKRLQKQYQDMGMNREQLDSMIFSLCCT